MRNKNEKKISGMVAKNLHRMTRAQLIERLEQLQYQQTLIEATERIAQTGHVIWDFEKNRPISCSEGYARIFKMSIEETMASQDGWEKTIEQIHPDDRADYEKSYESQEINRTHEVEYRVILNNGEIRNIREIGVVGTDNKGNIRGALGLLQDLTEQKFAEQEFKKMQQELVIKERLATLGKLTATVSHELRNPLGAMRPPLYTLKKNFASGNKTVINAIERLERNIERCDRIIDEMLDFTRLQSKERQLLIFDEWLSEVLDDQQPPDEISVIRDFGLGKRKIYFNPEGLRQALINLYDNACQVITGDVEDGKVPNDSIIKITTRATNERIELEVSDSGPGIPDHVLPDIFEPLFSTKSFGVGLGLPTVKQILEEHSGGIEVDTEECGGTRMVLWLPLSEEEEKTEGVGI